MQPLLPSYWNPFWHVHTQYVNHCAFEGSALGHTLQATLLEVNQGHLPFTGVEALKVPIAFPTQLASAFWYPLRGQHLNQKEVVHDDLLKTVLDAVP